MSRKYRVEQRFTTGWGLVSETSFKLSKDEAKKVLEELMAEGVNPDELRAIPDQQMYEPQIDDYVKWTTEQVQFTKDGFTSNVTLHQRRKDFQRQSITSQQRQV